MTTVVHPLRPAATSGGASHATSRRTALAVAGGGLAATCVVLVLVGLTITHLLGPVRHWDDVVNRWLAAHRTTLGNAWTDVASRAADTIGIVTALMLILTVLAIRRSWRSFCFVALAMALELSSFLIVNLLVDRPRPDVQRLGSLPATGSYPSGHTAAALVLTGSVAVLVVRWCRRPGAWIVATIVVALCAACVAYARVYRGMHHPSDVIAGALMGAADLAVARHAVDRWPRPAAVSEPTATCPELQEVPS